MNSKFVGVTKEIIESEVGQPAKVAVEFAVNTDDVATAKLFLDKINDFKRESGNQPEQRINKDINYQLHRLFLCANIAIFEPKPLFTCSIYISLR